MKFTQQTMETATIKNTARMVVLALGLCGALSMRVAACVPPPAGLVGWWPGDGNANDIQGADNGSLLGGATFGSGMVAQAFSLDGVDDYVMIPDAPNLTPAEVTVELWIRPNSPLNTSGPATVPFVRKLYENDDAQDTVRGYDLWYAGGRLAFGLPGVSLGRVDVNVPTNLPGGVWYHIAGTYDAAGGQRLYLDGQLVASRPYFGAIDYSPAPILLGRAVHLNLGGNPFYFDGAIDELSIYNRGLSAGEIAAIYTAGSSGKCHKSAETNFSDNFEGKSLDPFWSIAAQSGSVVFPGLTRAHGGSQALELATTDSGLNKDVRVYHQFEAPTYGTVSVWVYDTGADVASGNYIGLNVNGVGIIGTADYDLGPGDNGSTYLYNPAGPVTYFTGIERTQAWHQFTVCSWSNAVTLMIDGVVIYTGPGGRPMDRVELMLTAPSWRPAWSAQFDDFTFVVQPVEPATEIHMYAGLTITGTVNTPYQVQYKTSVTGTDWLPLADVLLPSSPYYFFDTNSPSAPQRYYRVVAKP